MENNSFGFWTGIGLGALLGVVVYRMVNTPQGRQMKDDIEEAMRKSGENAGNIVEKAKEKAWETGAKIADKVAKGTHMAAEKADSVKEKVHSMASEMNR